jgi:hypothetical protein
MDEEQGTGEHEQQDTGEREQNTREQEEHDIVGQVEGDVTERLGRYYAIVRPDGEDPDGFRLIDTFGDGGVVTGTSSTSEFTFVRWQWRGHHEAPIPSLIGEGEMVRATGNRVIADGLTVVEARRTDGLFFARWYVDWLAVYAQLGIVAPGRPVGMARTQVLDPRVVLS